MSIKHPRVPGTDVRGGRTGMTCVQGFNNWLHGRAATHAALRLTPTRSQPRSHCQVPPSWVSWDLKQLLQIKT